MALLPAAAARATVPSGFTETLVTSGLNAPTAMAIAPDGRLFVAQQGGALRVIKNGVLLSTPFVTLSVDSSGERGLLGVALDRNFAANGFVYVYYTTSTAPIHNRVSRFTASGDVAVAGSELRLLELDNLSSSLNHNGGALHISAGGTRLLIAVGENGNSANAQTLTNLLGKLLRINLDGSIPTDNPFYNTATGKNRAIWALGLRNPFTFAVKPDGTRILINDVGANAWEEINDGQIGSNYGWPATEGPTSNPNYRSPIFWYGHGSGSTTGCAIVGAAFYNPTTVRFPSDYVGDYFFGDLCSGWIRRLDLATGTATSFVSGINSLVDIAVANDGNLYYVSRGTGSVYRVSAGPTAVVVRSLAARRAAHGVTLSWRVGDGSRVLGFNVYRDRLRLNRRLLSPAARSFADRQAPSGRSLRYRLEVVAIDGERTWYERVATP